MKVVVDATGCRGHGLCAAELPELIRLDEWGYPIVAPGEVPAALHKRAKGAANLCPVLALRLQPA